MDKKIIKKILNLPYNTKLEMDSKIFAILRKTPKKTELSAKSDLQDAMDDASGYYTPSDIEDLDNLSNNVNDFQDLKNELTFKANKIYDTISNWETIDYKLRDALEFLKSALDRYAIAAEDIGFDPSQESVFVEGEDFVQEIEDLLLRFDTEYNKVDINDVDRFAE
jgi:hypothetical protein